MATRGALHSVVFPVCLCASVLLFLFLFFFSVFFLSFFSCCSFLLWRVFFFRFVFLSVGPSLEASARLARLLLAGVVHVCFFCCPTIRSFGPPRPASARRGRACVFFLLSYNSKLRPASPGFCSPGLSVFVSAAVLQFEVPLTAPGFCSLGLLCLLVVLLFRFCFAQFPIGLFLGMLGRLCFSLWSPRLVRAHRFLAASLGPGEQWRGPHVAPVASVPRGDAGRFRYLWGLGSGR